jgi:hypothetical protein
MQHNKVQYDDPIIAEIKNKKYHGLLLMTLFIHVKTLSLDELLNKLLILKIIILV